MPGEGQSETSLKSHPSPVPQRGQLAAAELRKKQRCTYLVLERQELLIVGDLVGMRPGELCLLWVKTQRLAESLPASLRATSN